MHARKYQAAAKMHYCSLKLDKISILTFSANDRHRYITAEFIGELKSCIARVHNRARTSNCNDTLGFIMRNASGSFCEGIDYGWLRGKNPDQARQEVEKLMAGMAEVVMDLLALPMPTAADVRGHAASLGLVLALAHDHVEVWPDAQLKMKEVMEGYALPRYVTALIRSKVPDTWQALDLALQLVPSIPGVLVGSVPCDGDLKSSALDWMRENPVSSSQSWSLSVGTAYAEVRKAVLKEVWDGAELYLKKE